MHGAQRALNCRASRIAAGRCPSRMICAGSVSDLPAKTVRTPPRRAHSHSPIAPLQAAYFSWSFLMSTITTPDSASRRNLLKGLAVAGVGLAAADAGASAADAKTPASARPGKPTSDRLITKDGTSLYFK